jgi:phospholipid/cholesterol/gamma-HCH transport system substrate-binding protein
VRSFRDRNPYAVGLISVLVIGLITGAAFSIGLLHLLEHTYKIEAVFTDASGLESGDKVRVAGVPVGRVTSVQADHKNGDVLVRMVVNHGVRLGKDSTAEIALETLLGSKYVRIGGPVKAPYMEDLAVAQRVIPVARTKTPFEIFELTTVSTHNIEALHTDALNQIINDLGTITAGKHASVTELVDGLDKVSAAINARDVQLRELLDRADTLSTTLAEKDQTLVQLIDASQKILDLISSRRDELATALGEGSDAVQQLNRIVAEHRVELDRILTTLHPTLDLVAKYQPQINRALAWVGPAFYSQGLAASHGPWLDVFIRSLGASPNAVLCQLLDPTDMSGACHG